MKKAFTAVTGAAVWQVAIAKNGGKEKGAVLHNG
jgi:hypothetical protein